MAKKGKSFDATPQGTATAFRNVTHATSRYSSGVTGQSVSFYTRHDDEDEEPAVLASR